jgi:hypothetical protein
MGVVYLAYQADDGAIGDFLGHRVGGFLILGVGTGMRRSGGARVLHESRPEQACRAGFTGHQ